MNMKKTIAAIAAGAVAVSAMATTVSAADAKTFTYNLVETVKTTDEGHSVVSYQIQNVSTDNGKDVQFIVDAPSNYFKGTGYIKYATVYVDYNDNGTTSTVDRSVFKFSNYAETGYMFDKEGLAKGIITVPGTSLADGVAQITVEIDYYHEVDDDDFLKAAKPLGYFDFTGTAVKGEEWKYDAFWNGLGWEDNTTDDDYKGIKDEGDTFGTDVTVNGAADENKTIDLWGDLTLDGANLAVPEYTYVKDYAKKGDKVDAKYPLKTSLTNNVNIITYLQGDTVHDGYVNGDDKDYWNVQAVINDAIANYDSVVFTFNTATEKVDTATGKYDADNGSDKYLSFAEHLYTDFSGSGLYTGEKTEFVGYDSWIGTNLFSGALVVNEAYTMSIADTEAFDYNAKSLSFDWDAVMDGVATSNGFATYVQSLKLATSSDWYWDSLTVTVSDGEADDATSDAGTTADDETLDDEADEELDDTADDEADDEEINADDVADDEAADDTVEVSNPTTGNASVALAVIPVALAAAAVVAKKRS